MNRRPGTYDQGFTLVEVLIALSVLGVALTAVFSLFSSGLNLRTVTRDRMAFDNDARRMINALTDDLAHLVPAGPPPMVSSDSIVLWRQQQEFLENGKLVRTSQLVTYQWSGSALQDSMLVRVAAPLAIDVLDADLVHQEFMRWARVFQASDATASYLLREDHGTRFGTRATLEGLSGSWISYPHIGGFACGIAMDPAEYQGGDTRSRVLVRLSPQQWPGFRPGPDPLASLALLPAAETDLEVGLWLPLVVQVPVEETDDPPGEVQP